jgi:pilus assembly protein CpaB
MRRKRPRSSRVLAVLSVVLAVATTLLLRGHLTRLEARASAVGPGQPVVVAVSDLDRGTVLEPWMVRVEEIPARYRPSAALADPQQVIGATLDARVTAGEAITMTRVAPAGGPVASLVPRGLVAVPAAVMVPQGMVAPGDRVHVLATFASSQPHTETVVSDVEVLKVTERSGDDLGSATTLILLVGPEDAERLAYARSFADLSVAIGSADPVAAP